jgi:hypothetical protein
VDSDLAEAISALKAVHEKRGIRAQFGKASPEVVDRLKSKLRLPRRYREFLLAADPTEVETRTPTERVQLIPAHELEEEQVGFALNEAHELLQSPSSAGWRPSWIVVARSGLLGDPYFLDTASPDPEGDCPVYTAMSGTDNWKPRLCASSFALFIRILAVGMELAEGFADGDDVDPDDEQTFRDALGPRLREYDPAALKAGHWT